MDPFQTQRRRLLRRGALALAAIPVLAWPRAACAAGAAKSDFHYQEQPNGDQRCANCRAFLPAPSLSGQADGTCSVVAGPVSPHGWCMAYARR